MSNQPLLLKCIAGPGEGAAYPVGSEVVTLGRAADNTVAIQNDSTVSSHHAVLTLRDDAWLLRDLNSKNGSWVDRQGNRTKIEAEITINIGDRFYLGSSGFELAVTANSRSGASPAHVSTSAPASLLHLELRDSRLRFHLTTSRPTAPVYEAPCTTAELKGWTRRFRDHATLMLQGTRSATTLKSLTSEFSAAHIPPRLLNRLSEEHTPLMLLHEPVLLGVPWAALPLADTPLGLHRPLSHQMLLQNQSLHPSLQTTHHPRFLFLVNPTSDRRELEETAQFAFEQVSIALPAAQHVYLSRQRVTRREVLRRLPNADIVYYAGHAAFDPGDPAQSGWALADGVLAPSELERLPSVPQLVMANGCDSARGEAGACLDAAALSTLMGGFLVAGVSHYLGTLWPVSADAGAIFAPAFVDALLAGTPVAAAVRDAREVVRGASPDTACWAAYTLLGDPAAAFARPT